MAINAHTALELLQSEFGEDGFEAAILDSVMPGVCMNCTAIADDCEPDARNNYCGECSKPRVRSWAVLAGVL